MLITTILPIAALTHSVTAACDLALLQNISSAYLATATTGKNALPLADPITYTENLKPATIATGMLTKAIKLSHNRTLHDTTQCATYTELIAPDNTPPYVIGTQIRVNADGKVDKIETLTTTTGDWLFNAKNTLSYSLKENRTPIPESDRLPRDAIKAAGDAYLDLFNNKSVIVPWGADCERLEGGQHVSPCNVGVPSGVALVNRRYVIDETVGTVDIMLNFGGNTGMPDSHEFRVEKGKLRLVHTITANK